MKFSSLLYGLNSFSSHLMGISVNPNNQIAAFGANNVLEGSNSFFETIWILLKTFVFDFATYIWELIVSVFVAIAQWILIIIDFCFVFIREFIGMNADYSDARSITEGDILFDFIFNDTVIKVIRGMIGFAILLLILFSIFAIIKSEYQFATQGMGDNSKKGIMVSLLKSLFLVMFVPIVFIGGLILSNGILKALYNATAGGTDVSMGTQIFISAGYSSNVYRNYATSDLKIPITYNFEDITESDNITGWGSSGSTAELNEALQAFKSSSVWNRGLTTFIMFQTNAFPNMSEVDYLDELYTSQGKNDPYHAAFDNGLHTKTEEYLVMADVVEYVLRHNCPVYFKTVQEVFESYNETLNSVPEADRTVVLNKMLEANERAGIPIGKDGAGNYSVSVQYQGEANNTYYYHKKNATDEAKGAVYLIALEKTIEYTGADSEIHSLTYYYPLISSEANFKTSYHNDCPVIAKGLFEEGEFPTAIKQEDGIVKFYRDKLNVPTILDLSPNISYEMPEGATEDFTISLIKKGVEAVTGVDISQFIPYVYYNFDIFSLFRKKSYSIAKLEDGKFYFTYFVTKVGFSEFGNVATGLNVENVYNYANFNLVVLLIGSAILFKQILKIVFGLAMRTLDIMLLAISYPAVISTMPLDNGSRFNTWKNKLIAKIVSIYGVVLAFNLVLLFIPAVYELDLITGEMIDNYIHTFLYIPPEFTSTLLNLWIQTMFILVAFSMVSGVTTIIDKLVFGDNQGITKDGENVLKSLKSLPEKAGKIITGQFIVDGVKNTVGAARNFIPGIGIKDYISEKSEEAALEASEKFKNTRDMFTLMSGDLAGQASNMMMDSAEAKLAEGVDGVREVADGRKITEQARQEHQEEQMTRQESQGAQIAEEAGNKVGEEVSDGIESGIEAGIDNAVDAVDGVSDVVDTVT